jgi:preprotein translocase subunit SecF
MRNTKILVGDFNQSPFSAGSLISESDTMIPKRTLGKLSMDDIARIEAALGDVRGEMKELREAVVGLVRVDEKVTNLIKMAETNAENHNNLQSAVWKRFSALNNDLTKLKELRAADTAVGEVYGKLLWPMFGGVIAIIATVVGAALLV